MPMYLFVEVPGLKKPNSKLPSEEINVSPSRIIWVVLIVSVALENVMTATKDVITRRKVVKALPQGHWSGTGGVLRGKDVKEMRGRRFTGAWSIREASQGFDVEVWR